MVSGEDMTDLEIIQRQLRESKMRLREVRTENAELKIQHRRWLVVSATVSVISLLLSFVMVFNSGDIVIQGEGSQMSVSLDAPVWHEESIPLPVNEVEDLRSQEKIEEITPPRFDDALEAPPLVLDEPTPSKPFRREPVLKLPSRAESRPEPVRSGFSLPSSSNKPKKRVEQYVVRKNDSLWKIVSRFYGTATPRKVQKVMKDNGLVNSQIKPGSTLLLIID
jgi:hypothetical protein